MENNNEKTVKNAARNRLFVFEGIDHVGKTTIVAEVSKKLQKMGVPCSSYSFPGKEKRTLGALVYDLHHNPDTYFDRPIDALSQQMLHVAAHIDTINNNIIPDLKDGKVVLLDRFWWSTYAYGIANGINKNTIMDIVLPEKKALGKIHIGQYFLVRRKNILADNGSNYSKSVLKSYAELGSEIQESGLLTIIDNDFDLVLAVESIVSKILSYSEDKNYPQQLSLAYSSENSEEVKGIFFFIKPLKLQATPVYNTYWKFATERQNIFYNRFKGNKLPWTDDSILLKYKFTNAYRASDRVSQYLIKEVIYNGRQYLPEDVFFRIMLFKLFNKIETWEYLQKKMGDIRYKDYRYESYNQALMEALDQKKTIYSAAYIMPSGQSAFGYLKKHQNNLKLLEKMMNDHLPRQIALLKSMEQLFLLLLSYPTLGKFLAFQYCIDINYSELCDFSEMSFVVAGPGAINGINRCFLDNNGYSDVDIIKYMAESQENEFHRLGLDFHSLWGRPLQLVDCQNLFCEIDKYARVAFPSIQNSSERKRIKQLFVPKMSVIDYFYPPKWNINQFIKREGD